MTREQQAVVLFLILSLTLFFWLTGPSTRPGVSAPALEEGASFRKPAPGEVLVEVEGSVRRRGVYRVPAGTTFLDLIERAGGVSEKMNLEAAALLKTVDRSCRLKVLPAGEGKGRVVLEPLAPPQLKVLSVPIEINSATLEELDTLPGIGPKTAQAILEYRRTNGKFSSPEDLQKVPGIGPKKFAALQPHISVK